MEKISEKHLRLAKVQKLREKILYEIECLSNYYKEELKVFCQDDELLSKFLDKFALEHTKLVCLKRFVNSETFFMNIIASDPSCDVVIYTISDKHLDMFLEEKFLFTQKFLEKVANASITKLDTYLDDFFFNFKFISTMEEILYDNKLKEVDDVIIPWV